MSKKSKSTSSTGYSKQALPYIQSASNAVTGAVNANAPNLAEVSGGVRSAFDKALETYQGGNPALTAGLDYAGDVLGGKYLGEGNPYLQQMIDSTSGDVTNRVQSAFGSAGRTGSGANTGVLTRELAKSEGGLRYADYDAERARMAAAMAAVPGLNEAQYSGLNTIGSLGSAAAGLPLMGSSALADAMKGLWGNNLTTTQTQSQGLGSSIAGLLGSGLSGWASGGFKL